MQRKECKISMKVAVLAVQGAFEEHEKVLQELGAQTIQLRQAKDLEDSLMHWCFRAVRVPFRVNFYGS